MSEYRLYHVDKFGRVAGPPDCFSCESDEAAIERARQQVDGHDLELWQLDRLVIHLAASSVGMAPPPLRRETARMPENLTMRRTVIGGDTPQDDYCVMAEGRPIGRIRLASERNWQGTLWVWAINVPLPIPAWGNGGAGSLDEAETRFRAAWESFRATLTEHDIKHWHHHQEAAASRSSKH